MSNFLTALLSGLGSGLVLAYINYRFTTRQIKVRDKKEFEGARCQCIEKLQKDFQYVKINYQRIQDGKEPDEGFVRNHETLSLTFIRRDLDLNRTFLPISFYDLMEKQYKITCDLALALRKDQSQWDEIMQEWEKVVRDISDKLNSDFYGKGIISLSRRR